MHEPSLRLALAALDASPQAFAAVGPDGRVVVYNRAAERLLGWPQDEVLGQPDPAVPSDAWVRYDAAVDRLREDPGAGPELVRRITKDGREIVLSVDGYVRLPADDGGHVVGAFFRSATEDEVRARGRNEFSRALVEATRVEQVLRVAGPHLQTVLGTGTAVVLGPRGRGQLHVEHVIGAVDPDASEIELPLEPGHAWTRSLRAGAAVGAIELGDGPAAPALFVAIGPPKEQHVLALVYERAAPTQPSLQAHARALGDELWLALQRARLVADLEDKIELLEATRAVAASAGLDLEDTVAEVLQHTAAALSCELGALYLVQPDGSLGLAERYGAEAGGQGDHLSFAVRAREADDVLVVQDAASEGPLDGPFAPSTGVVSALGVPLRVGHREVGVLVVGRTGTRPRPFDDHARQVGRAVAQPAAVAIDRAQLFHAERERVEQLREIDQLRADHVAGLTHDLRTPLTGLLGFTETLRRLGDDADAQERERYLAAMQRQASRLVAMVEEMLVANRLERGDMAATEREMIDVGQLVTDTVDGLSPARRERVLLEVAADAPTVIGDRSQLERVVLNLLDNAFKYGPSSGAVEVNVLREAARVTVSVRDHGSGLADEDVEDVFGRFRMSSRRRSDETSSGLGLFIARGIARAHGGDVTYAPAAGGGAVFSLHLPLARPEAGRG